MNNTTLELQNAADYIDTHSMQDSINSQGSEGLHFLLFSLGTFPIYHVAIKAN